MTEKAAVFLCLLAILLAGPSLAQGKFQDLNQIIRSLAPIEYLPEHSGETTGKIDLHVEFDLNKATLRPVARKQLGELAGALKSKTLKSARFLIAGHTDASGSADYNKRLSLSRARAIRDYMVKRHGIAEARLDVEGWGEERLKNPLVPTAAENRRAEIVRLNAPSPRTSLTASSVLSADQKAFWARPDLKNSIIAAQAVAQKADSEGNVRVIVTLNAPATSAPASQNGGFQNLNDYISNIQQQALDSLGWVNFNELVRLKSAPQMIMRVTKSELSDLRRSDNVYAIHEDKPNKLFLSDSVVTIGGSAYAGSENAGAGYTVAVLDTGVARHPLLAGKIRAEACFSTNGRGKNSLYRSSCPKGRPTASGSGAGNACDYPGCSHGTHVAGIVAGNAPQLKGVAPGAGIVAVQVFTKVDSAQCGRKKRCVTAFDSDILKALDWVYINRQRYNIIAANLSLGGGRHKGFCGRSSFNGWFDRLRRGGVAPVVASGNDGFKDAISSPACVSSAVSVGATDYKDNVAKFSNSGKPLDLFAPGTSAVPRRAHDGILSSVLDKDFERKSGTSMAAPHVAGAVAAVKSAVPKANIEQILDALKRTGKPVRDPKSGITRPSIRIDRAIGDLRARLTGSKPAPRPDPPPQKKPEPKPEPPPEAKPKPKPALQPAPGPIARPKPQPNPQPQRPREQNYDGVRVFDERKEIPNAQGKIRW